MADRPPTYNASQRQNYEFHQIGVPQIPPQYPPRLPPYSEEVNHERDVEQQQSYQQADAISNVSSQSYSSSLQNSHSDINSFDNLSEHNYDEISSQPGIRNTHMGTLALYDRNAFTSRRRLERFVERRRTNPESKNQVT